MLKIVLAADNHGRIEPLQRILNENPQADYYLHAGDSCLDPERIRPFASVRGNNDYGYDYPDLRIMELCGHRILLFHGTHQAYFDEALADFALNRNTDVVFFGHTHCFQDNECNGVRLINPGSCYRSREIAGPSYARVYIEDDGNIEVERVSLL